MVGMDARSERSYGSGASRYRAVGRSSNVDESLFGNVGAARKVEHEIAIVGKDTVQVRKKTSAKQGGNSDAVVIPATEMLRMRNNATMMTKAEEAEQKRIAEAAQEARLAKSKARKDRMV